MSAENLPKGPGFTISNQRRGVCRALVLLLTALTAFVVACQRAPTATEQWTPSYLELHLYSGKAQLQWPGESEWKAMEGKAGVAIEEGGRICADAVEGAKFFLGDGSTLELAPGATIEVQNPRTLPRLQVIVEEGSILFFGQKPSYEFTTPICPVRLLSVPSLIRIEVNSDTMRLAVEEGAVTCEMETETLTLPTCRQMYVSPEGKQDVTDFCTLSTVAAPPTPTSSPSPTPFGFEPTATATASPTPTPTRSSVIPTAGGVAPSPTHTPAPPTPEPAEPKKPKKTKPPPTQPPPTTPPEPTKPPEPTEPRPTPGPSEPTSEPSQPTAEPPKSTPGAPRPTTESS